MFRCIQALDNVCNGIASACNAYTNGATITHDYLLVDIVANGVRYARGKHDYKGIGIVNMFIAMYKLIRAIGLDYSVK